MFTKRCRRPAANNDHVLKQFIEKVNQDKAINSWPAWIPAVTAVIYFYDWIFEMAICYRLHIPVYLIEPTVATVLKFVLIFSFTIAIIVGVYRFANYANWKQIVASLFLMVLSVDAVVYYSVAGATWQNAIDFSDYGFFIWCALAFLGIILKMDIKPSIPQSVYVNLGIYIFISILITILLGYGTVAFSPPSSRIVGKEPLVIVKKYGDVVICRYLDTCPPMRLTDTIRVFKLDGSNSFKTTTLHTVPNF